MSGDSRLNLLSLWGLRSTRAAKGHYFALTWYRTWDVLFTSVNVVSAIAILGLASARWLKIEMTEAALGVAAIVNVITSVLQYIFDPRTRSKQHEQAAAAYAALNRAIEDLRSSASIENPAIHRVRTGLDHIGATAPSVPRLLWNRPKALSKEIEALEQRMRNASSHDGQQAN